MTDTAATIIAEIADLNGITVPQLVGNNRCRRFSWPRQDAYRAVRERTNLTLPQIGRAFGGRHHTTILHGIQASEGRARRERNSENA